MCFCSGSINLPQASSDEGILSGLPFIMPMPGTMVNPSPVEEPVIISGLTVHPDNPFLFDFIVDSEPNSLADDHLKRDADRLIKYFFTSLTIPDNDIWVNLSPFEKDRTIPPALSQTAMGRDLLAEDYMLKQLTASLIYPEKDLGKVFWNKVYTKAQQLYGTTDIPVNTFNKVWIVADTASVYEHGQTAFVVDRHLKVLLEEDYLAGKITATPAKENLDISRQILRQIIIPEIENEVNSGKNFSTLRQIFNSLILAMWYKKTLKEALLNQTYSDKNAVNGINLSDLSTKDQIYQQYLKAYEKGAFNYIKEDVQTDGSILPHKYFSGGFSVNSSMLTIAPGFSASNRISYLSRRVFTRFTTALTLTGALLTTMTALATSPRFPELSLPSWNITESVAKTPTNIIGNTALSNTNKIPLLEALRRSQPNPDFYNLVVITESDFRAAGVPGILAWNALAKPDSEIFEITRSGRNNGLRLIDPNVSPPLEMALNEPLTELFKRAQSSIIGDLLTRDTAAGLLSMIFEIDRLIRTSPEVPDSQLDDDNDYDHLDRVVHYLFGFLSLDMDPSGKPKLRPALNGDDNEMKIQRLQAIKPLLKSLDSPEFNNALNGRLNKKQLQALREALVALSIDYYSPIEELSENKRYERSNSWEYLRKISEIANKSSNEYLNRLKERGDREKSLEKPTNSMNPDPLSPKGGIDLKTSDLAMTITKDPLGGVYVTLAPALIARVKEQGIQSAMPVILDITTITSPQMNALLGF